MKFFESTPTFRFQTQRLLSECANGGGDPTEMGWAIARIADNDYESWFEGWSWLAERARNAGEKALADSHVVTARNHLFRAANYYRQAEFFLPHSDSRKLSTWKTMSENFRRAAELGDSSFEFFELSYENGQTLPGYFVKAQASDKPLPTVIYLNGADGTKEESWYLSKGFVDRGMNFVTIDGPGQGQPLREQHIYTRPDYEAAVTPLLDHVLRRPDVDPDRVALVGASMGGYYGARAACFEPRFRCLLLHSAVYNIRDDLYDNFPPIRAHLQWVTGTFDDQKARERLDAFDVGPHLHRIRMPVLIGHGDADVLTNPNGASKVFAGLANVPEGDKTLRVFSARENAGAHNQVDNPTEAWPVLMDWVLDQLQR
ncbi:MAG TPA: alpha/beta fold hydrolase [Sphingobium sp.]|nr:alpha/beta fold hydrolase [Sphingobium sp.]